MSGPLIRRRSYEMFDGSRWELFESPDSIIWLTGVGREMLAGQRISSLLHDYIADYCSGREAPTDTRRFLAEGGNARVFSVDGTRLAIKEARKGTSDHLLASLNRMDRLVNAIEQHCPRWIDVPSHYGLLLSKNDPTKQFMLMQKIDEGVTVGDVINSGYEPREPHLGKTVEEVFGNPVEPETIEEVNRRYFELRGHVRSALMREYLRPEEYLPDIDTNPYNVVLEQLDNPVAGSHIKYWLIDQ